MNKNIEKLLKAVKENPKLEIFFMTHYEVCCCVDFAYWKGEIEKVAISDYWQVDKGEGVGIYFDEDIMDKLHDDLFDEHKHGGMSNEKYDQAMNIQYELMKKNDEIKTAIVVYINV